MSDQDMKPRNLKTAITRMEAAERKLAEAMQTISNYAYNLDQFRHENEELHSVLTTWIPCSERMPAVGKRMLICVTGWDMRKMPERTVEIGTWRPNQERWYTHLSLKIWRPPETVTHWRDLPDLPGMQYRPAYPAEVGESVSITK